MPIVTAEELSDALGQLGELREQMEVLREWQEGVRHEAEFMAQMTARARSRRNARLRLIGYVFAGLTVTIQLAIAIHIFLTGH